MTETMPINRPLDLNEKVYLQTVELCHFFNISAGHRVCNNWAPQVEVALAKAADFMAGIMPELEQGWSLVKGNAGEDFVSPATIEALANDPERSATDLIARDVLISADTQDKLENIADAFNMVSYRIAARVALDIYSELQWNGLQNMNMFYQKSGTGEHKAFNRDAYILASPI